VPFVLFGSTELQDRFLPRCASGEWWPAFALSEPDAGSDPGGMLTRAVRDGDEWVIDGTKNWITNLGIADFYVVFAVTDPQAGHGRGITAFVVEADRPGFSVGKLEHKLGIRGSPTGQPIFDGVREEEVGHRQRLIELYRKKFGEHIPLIRRQDVRGFVHATVVGHNRIRGRARTALSMRVFRGGIPTDDAFVDSYRNPLVAPTTIAKDEPWNFQKA